MQITLLRHGRPEYELRGVARGVDLPAIVRAYDEAGVVGEPSDTVLAQVAAHKVVVCSDLRRSLHSAALLGIDDVRFSDALFREAAIPHFDSGSLRLPVSVWVILLRSLWLGGFSRNGETIKATRSRAGLAAHRLMELATEFDSVLLVGHGFINYFIAKELLSSGWSGPSQPGRSYWEFGAYLSAG